MASGLELRRAGATDTSLLHAMLQELAEATGHSGAISGTPKDLLKYGFGDDPRFFAVLATVDGGNAGMLLAFPEYSSWRGCPGIYVQDLYVRKEYRSLGIAHALLAEAAREAARMGGSYLRLSVAAKNEPAARFYSKAGFTESTEERMFVCEGPTFTAMCGHD
ncbi:MAG: GNAT family N-acetyltransferase [Alphaproteobacteria bacterium]|nr:MAG: GNAT family N-acetyltransferase [Alphaproteobacteria bacterium]